ncbi:uncharacterized protein LOC132741675 isoform X2 [Ruditapes philippinarum]|uniref:uncharacterized protein LOC132741675 isoform X2 n=1 Tax=Ruditapes philippinarum TaxID=129788 RepID=UPI00295ABE72|nr:uncharacterized protein LOC132741675 isoform X2 [Ruditapes philippinarum]
MGLLDTPLLYDAPSWNWNHYTVHGVPQEVEFYPGDRHWTWKPLQRAYRQRSLQKQKQSKMVDSKRSEAILKNLAQELLTDEECLIFKQALHHFRVSHSVPALCQQLRQVINTTPKILLLVELSMRMPSNLQDDFHRLCSLQFPNYDSYLKIITSGNANEMPHIIAQDNSGKIKVVSRGSEKKLMMKYNNQKQTYELRSLPGTSITSGVYSNGSDSDDDDFDEIEALKDNQGNGRATPIHLEGKKNVHKVFLNRHEDGSLGLGITGGKEYGTELVINVVEEEGPAASQGLQVGDKILEVNGHNFHNITHAEAVMIMRNAWNLIILIERPNENEEDTDDVDRAVSRKPIKDLEIVVYPSNTGRLGCITQRLPSSDLLVQSVELNSSAEKAGLQVHDLIYKVDGVSVRELSEKQIVMLTKAKRINMNIKRYEGGDNIDGLDGNFHLPTPNQPYRRSESEPRSDGGRHHSSESHHSRHHSSNPSPRYVSNFSSYSPHSTRRLVDHPEHLVYGNRPVREANWIISPKPREHRYTQRRQVVMREANPRIYHNRSRSEERYDSRSHPRTIVREISVPNAGKSRYIRNRSHSAHKNTIQRVHHEDNVIRAIQMGLEKRQRAVRLSLYQMPDPVDYEWEI